MIAPILNFAHQPSLLVRPLRSRKMDLERCLGAKAQLAPAARRAGQPTWRCTGQPSSGKTRSLQASLQCAPRCVRGSPASQSRLAIQLTRPPEIISGTPGMSVRSAPRARRRPIERQRRLPDRQATSRQPAIGAQESQLPPAMQARRHRRQIDMRRGRSTATARQPACVLHDKRPKKKPGCPGFSHQSIIQPYSWASSIWIL